MEENKMSTLAMPKNYACIGEDEMQCTNGGWCVDVNVWGYNVYLTHEERKILTDAQAVGGLVAALASLGVGAAVIGAVSAIIWNHDEGHGVRIRLNGLTNPVATGVFALSSADERNIASKNKITF